jgi:alpha/beta hydrolase fold
MFLNQYQCPVTCCLILLLLYLCSYQLTPRTLAQSMTYQADRSPTTHPSTAAETFVTAGKTKLHYVERGQGRPVVMIHGNAGDLHDFELGTFDLLARNYHAIAFDLPGHGLSKEPGNAKGTIQEQAKILHLALTALGVKDPILVGHSWGATFTFIKNDKGQVIQVNMQRSRLFPARKIK